MAVLLCYGIDANSVGRKKFASLIRMMELRLGIAEAKNLAGLLTRPRGRHFCGAVLVGCDRISSYGWAEQFRHSNPGLRRVHLPGAHGSVSRYADSRWRGGYGRGTTVILPKLTSVLKGTSKRDPVLASALVCSSQFEGSVVPAGQIFREYKLVVLFEFRCTANFSSYFTPSASFMPDVSRIRVVSG
jgi:hypothetical protein